MKLKTLLKEVRPVLRNRQWLSADIQKGHKYFYYFSIISTYTKFPFGKRSIKYLGRKFYFDNIATPLNLQTYPYEIDHKILRHMKKKPQTVLDVGANIGQFSATLSYFQDLKQLDVFEPNVEIIYLLEKNLRHLGKKKRIFTYGLSSQKNSKAKMYYEPGRSTIGSLLVDNAGSKKNIKSAEIKLTNNPSDLTKRSNYDLIKVDVEGFEIEAIKALKKIKTKYLFLEISSHARTRNYTESELFSAIKSSLGGFEMMYSTGYDGKNVAYEVLLKFQP